MAADENRMRFHGFAERALRTVWEFMPVGATLRGVHDYDHTLGDLSADAFRHYAKAFAGITSDLTSEVDPNLLDPDDARDYQLALSLASAQRIALERERTWQTDPSLYVSTAIWGCYSMLIREFAPLDERAASMLSRMREIPGMLEASRGNISEPPRVHVELALDMLRSSLPFFLNGVPSIASKVPGLEAELLSARDSAAEALEDYGKWLHECVTPHASGSFAIGEDVYHEKLGQEHLLTCSPSDLVAMGRRVLEESFEEIEELAASIDPSRSWQELIAHLKHQHPEARELAGAYREAIESARAFVIENGLIDIPCEEHIEVSETPPFERFTLPFAGYFPSAPFEPGYSAHFWVTPIDMSAPRWVWQLQLQDHSVHAIPIMAVHEAYPGHHVQFTRAKISGSALARQVESNLLVEGWALYCEDLMWEQGFYGDPRVRLFQLKGLIWRACRVIIDVGLHSGEMTFDDAARMLVDTAKLEYLNALAEVRRYAASPTQPMTYVIGKLLLEEIRDKMKQRLGAAFDLKDFHNRLLDYAAIPPALIAEDMLSDSSAGDESAQIRRSA